MASSASGDGNDLRIRHVWPQMAIIIVICFNVRSVAADAIHKIGHLFSPNYEFKSPEKSPSTQPKPYIFFLKDQLPPRPSLLPHPPYYYHPFIVKVVGATVEVECKAAGTKIMKAYVICKAKLHAPPKHSSCSIPTKLNQGTNLEVKSKNKYEVVLKAKPFAYAPYKEECEKPKPSVPTPPYHYNYKSPPPPSPLYLYKSPAEKYSITVQEFDDCQGKVHAP
ncbi:putative extensin-2-like isoform X1 [Sesbania bispinosa]|nr:putative extensin-2-like isoform X1 [Sesbania bispinosa]